MRQNIDRRGFLQRSGALLLGSRMLAAGNEIDCDVAVIGGGARFINTVSYRM